MIKNGLEWLLIAVLVLGAAGGCAARSRVEVFTESHDNAVAKARFGECAVLTPAPSGELDIHNELPVPISFKLVIDDTPDAWLFVTVDPQSRWGEDVPDFQYRLQVYIGDLQDKELYYQSNLFSVGRGCTITVYEVDRWETKGFVDPFRLFEMDGDDFWH